MGEESKLEPQEIVMIGDDVKDNVLGAQSTGMTGILVKTFVKRKIFELKRHSLSVCQQNVLSIHFIDFIDTKHDDLRRPSEPG